MSTPSHQNAKRIFSATPFGQTRAAFTDCASHLRKTGQAERKKTALSLLQKVPGKCQGFPDTESTKDLLSPLRQLICR